ncbi:hypothetical protein NECAME_01643 [Necator americanus]|uniref:BAR domain-containing protein n=1 Tax=Necator americanus TaxID=51031 RepID=W2TTP0_NECAM|nr:hypothetical protein NECAME_01643 [Necator americanus]ETN84417.1 hypothetical protein NECAME_01643 [Necator americanus]
MDKAKKKFASAIDGLRSLHNRIEIAVDEKIQPEHCCFEKVVSHSCFYVSHFTAWFHLTLILSRRIQFCVVII